MNFLGLLHSSARRLWAAWHGGCGRLSYRLGRPLAARRHFERVLDLDGDVFAAYVHLGRLAWQVGDYSTWRREFEHARRVDPQRFARLRQPFELFEPHGDRTASDETGERATWRSVRPASSGRRGTVHRVELPLDGEAPHVDAANRDAGSRDGANRARCEPFTDLDACAAHGLQRGDDFASDDERTRFAGQRPITPQEIGAVDLDQLCQRFG